MQKNKTNKQKKQQDASMNMSPCHFHLIVIAIESSLKIQK